MKHTDAEDWAPEMDEALLISAIEIKLAMTPEERIEAHEAARTLAEDLRLAGERLRARLKTPS